MLEDLAYRYSEMSEDQLRALGYTIAIAGGLLGGLTSRSTNELQRAPYFALTGLIFLLTAVAGYCTTPFVVQLMAGGYFWVVVGVELVAGFVAGFFVARIAGDRSRDAYGHGRLAALAFIPLANFWLLLTASKKPLSANRVPTIPALTGGIGVVSGFVMLAGGVALSTYSQIEAEKRVEAAASAGMFNETLLDRILVQMASEVKPPVTVDEVTTLLRLETEGTSLRYVYELSNNPEFLSVSMRSGLLQHNCANEGLRPVIDAGATIWHTYLRVDGSEIGTVEVTKQACGY